MLTIILHSNGEVEVMHSMNVPPHIVIVHEREEWTDSPSIFTDAPEAEQAEQLAIYRGEGGFVDRNP